MSSNDSDPAAPHSRLRSSRSDDYEPLAWVGRYPVYASTALVLVHAITAILTALVVAFEKSGIFSHLYFSSAAVSEHLEIWQFVTYAFVNFPSILFAIDLAMLFWFGRQLELFIGRTDFLLLYGFLLLLPPCLLMAVGAFTPVRFAGSSILHFSVFLAFVCLYPEVEIFFGIKAKWVGGILLAIYLLQMLAYHQWVQLLVMILSAFTAFFFIGRLRYGFEFPGIYRIKQWVRFRPSKAAHPRRTDERNQTEDLLVTVDSLLEKISSTGIGSLSEQERAKLSQASEELKARSQKSKFSDQPRGT